MKKHDNHHKMIRAYRTVEMIPARNGEYWREEERDLLAKRYSEGVGISEIALELQRSESSIFQQLSYLNIIKTPNERRPYCRKARCLCIKCDLREDCPYKEESIQER